ncbi:MAG: M28 family peptidase [Bacteroidota bacterium]
MKKITSLLACLLAFAGLQAQINITCTNATAEQVLLGNYDPADYVAPELIRDPNRITSLIQEGMSTDTLLSYLQRLSGFRNRNTASDTTSATEGIGAARRWVYSKFEEISADNGNRLLPSYLQFTQTICTATQHRNVFAVLPGRDTSDLGYIIIQGHLDSRCEDPCDIDCLAQGAEDNASGTALVIELARIMSQYSFDRTIVFMATTGEEQGLFGANAFARYADRNDMAIKAVLNNDTVGGIICGETSSEPSCPGLNHIDSTQVRLFSGGSNLSPNKSLARYIKLQYQDQLQPISQVPMMLTIMSAEDRMGRGGDHIPFRQRGYPAMRFTAANEHGNADPSSGNYRDRQHSVRDILGVDTDGDNIIDSFFVDLNYLARNAAINGVAAAMISNSPETPSFELTEEGGVVMIDIADPLNYGRYALGVRTNQTDFDTLIYSDEPSITFIPRETGRYYFAVAAVDSFGLESCFSQEILERIGVLDTSEPESITSVKSVELLPNRPNPFDDATYLGYWVSEGVQYKDAYILVTDLAGKELRRLPVDLRQGINEVLYRHGYNVLGTFVYSMVVDGKIVDSRQMIFAN